MHLILANGQLGNGTLVDANAPVNTLFTPLTSYTYGNASHKHAVTALSTGESYTYDANGNTLAPGTHSLAPPARAGVPRAQVPGSAGVTSRVEGGLTYTQTFDAENRLISVTVSGQTTQFVYDGDGNPSASLRAGLVKKIKPDGSRTLYVGGVYEVDKNSGGTVTGTKTYYPVVGAMRIDSTLYYVLKDHLGSASVVTDSTGAIIGEERYYSFGETRFTTGSMFTDKLFTSQREMAGLGIYDYGARFYSPKLGRFLSADTIVPSTSDPQNLNRFSYVGNNPLRYTDPTGHIRLEDGPQSNGCSNPTYCQKGKPKPAEELKKMRKAKKSNGGGPSTPTPAVTLPTPTIPSSIVENYCGNISGLACAANATQDVATLIDLVGVGLIEAPAVATGCIGGGPLGCAIAEVGVAATWTLTLNNAETVASLVSFGFTLGDDLSNNGGWGENSATSLATLLAGQLPLTPSWDLVVDTYSSGYNHGVFNGVYTIGNGLLKP